MTMLTFEVGSRRATWTHTLASIGRYLSHAIDAFVAARARQSISASELRRTEREINRYRRMMQGDLVRQVHSSLAGSAPVRRRQQER